MNTQTGKHSPKFGKTFCALAACVVVLAAGCVVTSVGPYYTEQQLVFEPTLLGKWQKVTDEKQFWKFEKQGEDAYRLTYAEGDKSWVVTARSFRLGGELFLDLFAGDKGEDLLPPPIPSHFLLRVLQVKPNVRMAALHHDWLAEHLEKNPGALHHHFVTRGDNPEDRRVVVTASTAELQEFILKHLKNEDAWQDSFDLKRAPQTGSELPGDK